MLVVDAVSFAYGGVQALSELSFAAAPGSLVILAGANGGGKSTLLRLLAGLARPDAGSVSLAGLAGPGKTRELRRAVGMVMQEADFQIVGATVGEDLLLGGADEARARGMAARFGLEAAWGAPVQTLSHGQKRKLCVAGALLEVPRVLLMDEPMAGLDYPAQRELRGILQAQRDEGLLQVVAAHDLEPLVDLADQVLVLEAGRLVLDGPPADVLDRVTAHGVRPPCAWLHGRGLEPWA